MNIYKKNKGFTLIELLVVVAIIGLLSAVVLASLNSARAKARTSKFIQQIDQFSKLLELEYSNTGTYVGLTTSLAGLANSGWAATVAECDLEYGSGTGRTSSFLSNANEICKSIVTTSVGTYPLHVSGDANRYSVEGWLYPGSLLYCMGSSGKTLGKAWGDGPPTPSVNLVYNNVGCSSNP